MLPIPWKLKASGFVEMPKIWVEVAGAKPLPPSKPWAVWISSLRCGYPSGGLPLNILKAFGSQALLKEGIKVDGAAEGAHLRDHGFGNVLKTVVQQLQEGFLFGTGFPLLDCVAFCKSKSRASLVFLASVRVVTHRSPRRETVAALRSMFIAALWSRSKTVPQN